MPMGCTAPKCPERLCCPGAMVGGEPLSPGFRGLWTRVPGSGWFFGLRDFWFSGWAGRDNWDWAHGVHPGSWTVLASKTPGIPGRFTRGQENLANGSFGKRGYTGNPGYRGNIGFPWAQQGIPLGVNQNTQKRNWQEARGHLRAEGRAMGLAPWVPPGPLKPHFFPGEEEVVCNPVGERVIHFPGLTKPRNVSFGGRAHFDLTCWLLAPGGTFDRNLGETSPWGPLGRNGCSTTDGDLGHRRSRGPFEDPGAQVHFFSEEKPRCVTQTP